MSFSSMTTMAGLAVSGDDTVAVDMAAVLVADADMATVLFDAVASFGGPAGIIGVAASSPSSPSSEDTGRALRRRLTPSAEARRDDDLRGVDVRDGVGTLMSAAAGCAGMLMAMEAEGPRFYSTNTGQHHSASSKGQGEHDWAGRRRPRPSGRRRTACAALPSRWRPSINTIVETRRQGDNERPNAVAATTPGACLGLAQSATQRLARVWLLQRAV